jgi:hypothetical protein
MTDAPLVPGPLYGLRTWRVVHGPDGERLAAPLRDGEWPAGGEWLLATCDRGEHAVPGRDCDCGIHGWHPRRASARRVLGVRREVPGIVEADGEVEVHEEGFRAERAQPYALVVAPGGNAALVERLAAAYDVPVVEVAGPDELLAWCRERGLGLAEPVVERLLGPQPAAERRRRGRTNALRLVVALVVGALLVLAGLQLTSEPDHDLYGRGGKVERPSPSDSSGRAP